jgi:pimeloyl-ACP methyl ester carboxylesterase
MEATEHLIPAPRASFDAVMSDGAVIRIRQHGNPRGPRLLLSHGNGLAIDGYFPFWGPLREKYEVIVFDQRNHGQNPLGDPAAHTWARLVEDLEEICRAIGAKLGRRRAAGVFHSLSAVVSAAHALEYGRRFDALVLFDPPIHPREGHPLRYAQSDDKSSLASRARRRTERYRDPAELARGFRRGFKHWVPEAYEMMARATLRRDPETGDWTLACPRELEARIFSANADPALWPRMAHCPVPVKLVCGDPEHEQVAAPALIGRAMARELGLEYEAIPGTTHFLQIEKPAECIRAMESFLRKYGLAAQ